MVEVLSAGGNGVFLWKRILSYFPPFAKSAQERNLGQSDTEMADKVREQQVYEHLKNRHIGLGDADTTKHEWMVNVHRDSCASALGHASLLEYLSLANDTPKVLLKQQLIEKMVRPCGPPPPPTEE